MARYQDSSFTQSKFIPVVFSQQITPGTFEHTITFLIDEHLDMSVFDARYKNDDTGRLAYDPAMLLRVILSAYARGFTSSRRAAEDKNIASLRKASRKIKKFCKTSEERRGLSGKVIKSNITDNESASMLTSHGNLQGYNGVAAVDAQNQIVIAAQAFGQGPENNLLKPLVEQARSVLGDDYINGCTVSADSGFHSRATLKYCADANINALIADGNFRIRDRYVPKKRRAPWFMASEFYYDPQSKTCRCPAGKLLWHRNTTTSNGHCYVCYSGYLKDCRSCPLQARCMRKPPKEQGRQVSFRVNEPSAKHNSVIDNMKARIDSEQGRYLYGKRLGTVEPVFGNINTTTKGSDASVTVAGVR